MTREKEAIIEYAKELFLTPDISGKHKYSTREIATEIQQKFNKKINNSTICIWSHKYHWDALWKEGVREGITKVLAKEKSNRTKEEQLKQGIAERKQKDFTIMEDLKDIAYKYIKKHNFTTINEALRAIETAMKYTQDLNDFNNDQSTSLKDFIFKLLQGNIGNDDD